MLKLFTKEQITIMVDLQRKLNEKVHPQWNEQNYDWELAFKMEASELMDSFPWKHWKDLSNVKPDLENAKVEEIDLWHFILSSDIQRWLNNGATDTTIIECLVDEYNGIIEHINSTDLESYSDTDIIKELLRLRFDDGGGTVLSVFFAVMVKLGMSIDDLFKGYVVKNILNNFRQDNGYKEGTYIKMWFYKGKEVEDNVVAFDIAESLIVDEDFTKNLKKILANKYEALT